MRLWGAQHPFERNHLQRGMTLLAISGVLGVTVVLLARTDVHGLLGLTLVAAGLVSGLGAWSRWRYVTDTRRGFDVLRTRGGAFVLGSAALLAVTAAFVVLLIAD